MPASVEVPTVTQLYWPTLQALEALGGSGTVTEIEEKVIEIEGYSEELQAVPHTQGTRTKLEYRLAWARTHLRMADTVENSARGVWALTDVGRAQLSRGPDNTLALVSAAKRSFARITEGREPSLLDDADDVEPSEDEGDWQTRLLEQLIAQDPASFERLAARLLREAGFVSVNVTGRSGDGGIDGLGVLRVSLMSFPVFFQCKRHRGSVGSAAVRDFRGAMAGRGDKGLLITTGSFTAEAQREATRDGAPPIDLIDGDALCDLLRQYGLGVSVTTRTVESVEIDPEFFEQM
jgi:restriction system protein